MAWLLLRLREEESIVCGYQSLVEMYHVPLLSKKLSQFYFIPKEMYSESRRIYLKSQARHERTPTIYGHLDNENALLSISFKAWWIFFIGEFKG